MECVCGGKLKCDIFIDSDDWGEDDAVDFIAIGWKCENCKTQILSDRLPQTVEQVILVMELVAKQMMVGTPGGLIVKGDH